MRAASALRRSAPPLAGLLLLAVPVGAARAQRPVAATAAVMSVEAGRVAAQTGGTVRVWERATGKLACSVDGKASFFRGAVATEALGGIFDEKLVVWRGGRCGERVALRGLPKVTTFGRVFVAPDASLVAALYPAAGDARDPDSFAVWDARRGAARGAVSWPAGSRVLGLVLGRAGLVAAFGDEPGKRALLRLYRVVGTHLHELLAWSSASERTTYSAALSADGKRLALGAGERILLWDLSLADRPLLGSARTKDAGWLLPAELQRLAAQIPGAHQLQIAPDGRQLAALHGFGVAGVAIWELAPGSREVRGGEARSAEGLRPLRWVKRPPSGEGATLRQLAWDASGELWLVTAGYGRKVFVHRARGSDFVLERTLAP
jgi:hypothetical protein